MTPGKILLTIFICLCLLNLWGEYLDSTKIVFFTKPLLIISLGLWFFYETRTNRSFFSKMILGALIFSVGGDTLLMFVENSAQEQHYFLLGLGSFLIAHLFYIIAFIKYPSEEQGLVKRQIGWGTPFILYFFGITCYLLPDIPKEMSVPVVVYSAVIVTMIISALNVNGRIPDKVFIILFSGTLLFMISDTFIALNKFKAAQLSIPQPRLIIMMTYLLGQFLIVKASSKMNDLIDEPSRL